MRDPLIYPVGQLLRHAARKAVLPLFRQFVAGKARAGDVLEKAPGEVVTVADREAEKIISAGLRDLLPGSAVVGEEGVAADPTLLERLADPGPVWLVDPVDGTANYASGHGPFVMMIALVSGGLTRAGWILDPRSGSLFTVRRGYGAYRNGQRVYAAVPRTERAELRGAVLSRFLPVPLGEDVRTRAETFGAALPGQHCAGQEYPDVVRGRQDFVLFWHTLPWDHAAGALFTEEAGGVVRRLDGSAYDPADLNRPGLLAATSEPVWWEVRDTLFPQDAVNTPASCVAPGQAAQRWRTQSGHGDAVDGPRRFPEVPR